MTDDGVGQSHKGVGRPFPHLLIEKEVQQDARLAAKLLNNGESQTDKRAARSKRERK